MVLLDGSGVGKYCYAFLKKILVFRLEQQLQSSGGAQDWNYCIPVTDYAIIRKRAKEEFANKSKLVIELISEVNNETSRLKAELEIGYMSCNIRLLFFFIAQA
eukprot:GHVR01173706.1.p2 GENE.GHVR01173706.1~~GHVR01173706.1.p2  ORF type:complete len:103 (+),score=12.01 GHVR01173706.1:412-720(+)